MVVKSYYKDLYHILQKQNLNILDTMGFLHNTESITLDYQDIDYLLFEV